MCESTQYPLVLMKRQGGKYLSKEDVVGSELYQENMQWIKSMKDSGHTIVDIGNEPGRDARSTFYEMEKEVIYGGSVGGT